MARPLPSTTAPTLQERTLELGLALVLVAAGCARSADAQHGALASSAPSEPMGASSSASPPPIEVPQALRDAHAPERRREAARRRESERRRDSDRRRLEPRAPGRPPPLMAGLHLHPPQPPTPPALVGALLPLPGERLLQPLELPGCPELSIIEWRDSGVLHVTSKPHPKLIAELGALCRQVITELDRRLDESGAALPVVAPLRLTMSVLPPGNGPRELNDAAGRMRVEGPVSEDTILGSYWPRFRHAFMHNGVGEQDGRGGLRLSKEASCVFAHELFHALVHQRGVRWHFEERGGEEAAAREFTASLGLGR